MRKTFNEHSRALCTRAGTAGAAVAVDTRVKTVPVKKGRRGYRRRDKHACRSDF